MSTILPPEPPKEYSPATLIGTLISMIVALVVGVNLIPVIRGATSNVTESFATPVDYVRSPSEPTWALVVLTLALIGLVGVWIWYYWRTHYVKA